MLTLGLLKEPDRNAQRAIVAFQQDLESVVKKKRAITRTCDPLKNRFGENQATLVANI